MKLISNDDKHIVYKRIGVNDKILRYLKVIKELHRNDLHDLSREEKLAFYINLYNMVQFMQVCCVVTLKGLVAAATFSKNSKIF